MEFSYLTTPYTMPFCLSMPYYLEFPQFYPQLTGFSYAAINNFQKSPKI